MTLRYPLDTNVLVMANVSDYEPFSNLTIENWHE